MKFHEISRAEISQPDFRVAIVVAGIGLHGSRLRGVVVGAVDQRTRRVD